MTYKEALSELEDSIKGAGYQCHIETYKMAIDALRKLVCAEAVKTPCDVCRYNPPSSGDGKPCTMCPASPVEYYWEDEGEYE